MSLTVTQVMDGRPCWERLNGERGKAFAAFQHFRDQGPTRTMRATAQMLIKTFDKAFDQQEEEELIAQGKTRQPKRHMSPIKKESTAIGTLHNWATKYAWQERAEFFDRHLDRQRIEQMETDTRHMATRHIEFSTTLIDLAKKKLEQFQAGDLSPMEALKFGAEGVKIERLTRMRQGEATGIEEPIVPGEVKSSARDELKRRIDAIAEKKAAERERAAAAVAEKAAEAQVRAEPASTAPIQAEPIERSGLRLEKSG